MRPPSSSSSSSSSSSAMPAPGGGGRMSTFTMRAVARMSRARWFIFLRRVYQYQNGPRSDLGSNPFNSPGWLALELGVIVAQMVLTTAVVATSPAERPAWPLRLWVAAYNVGNVLSLPLLYWRHRHSSAGGRGGDALSGDLEMHGANDALRDRSCLMNKARAFLELFFAMWFVMGNVWVFDARLGSFQRAPRLYALCISLLAWNAVVYSLPFLLFLLLCCFVPMVGYALGYNMNSASVGRGASDEQLAALPRWRFKEPADVPRDREHDDQMVDYNVLGGKCNRGLSVIDSYKILKGVDVLSKEETFLACTLGWCIEWLQAYFLVLDDIMDNSQTRRGQPCWFRVPQVGLIAVNDGIILRNHISRILQRHFKGKPYYVDLIDLFNEVEFKTASGQLLDLITTHEGEKDLTKYNLTVHRRIVQYKTAYYSFYLPVACALLLAGENLDNFGDVKNILVEMGTYFQVQDDYLDCFGDPEFIGKIGTDIEDYKCSWLVVQALERADENQKSILFENYGKSDPACVAKVKDLYKELKLEEVFHEYERESYNKLIADIEAQPSTAVQTVLKSFLHKIYKRDK